MAAAKIPQNTHPEKIIIKEAVENIRRFISDQSTYYNCVSAWSSIGLMGIDVAALQDKLDSDLALLRRAFNQRILYFRQLQEISDSVTDVEWEEPTLAMALQASLTERATLETKMNTTRARQRYLDNLVDNHDGLDSDEDDRVCILCRCDFTRGYITQWYETLFLFLRRISSLRRPCFCGRQRPCILRSEFSSSCIFEDFYSLLSRCVWEPGFYAKRVKHALSVGKIEKLQIRLPLTFTTVLLLTLTLCNVSPLTLSIWNHLPRNPKLVNQPPNQAERLHIMPLVFNCRVIYDHWRLIVLG